MNLFSLLQQGEQRLQSNDVLFHSQVDVVLGILRSTGSIPSKRTSLNGELHRSVAAALVMAYEEDTTVDVAVRRAETFYGYGFSTKIISYLDEAVANGLLIAKTAKAKGRLHLGQILEDYLDETYFNHIREA
jgi:hypothetical protein|tara:strand:- start:70 stop:465 length:396 start_codon:yes stop_codon:yes gene_type:complete